GKGYLNGTQTHLEFLPERTTDFIFAVFSEEFGLLGNLVLLSVYLFIMWRGFVITANASTYFTRLMAGSITLTFFTYAFVNMGMVTGILLALRAEAQPGVTVGIGDLLGHEISNVRKEAAAALGEISDPAAIASLERGFDDPDPDVRKLVRWALERCRAAA
ncbi:MAG: hypothetical protein B7Y01_02750, partial [Xanthobacter sp. 17-67-6]